MELTHALTPITIGSLTIKNRIFQSAHGLGFGGTVADRAIAYHEARARGGIGLSILEGSSVHPSVPDIPFMFNAWSGRENGDGYKRLIDTCRPYGIAFFQQIHHSGVSIPSLDGAPLWSSSDLPGVRSGSVAIPMTKAMIDDVVDGFANAAAKYESYGLNGVEIHAGHGYLLNQFLSPLINSRQDDYGGSFDNRARIVFEIAEAIRAAVSANFVVGIRVGDDLNEGGFRSEDYARLCQALEARGLIDYVSITLGSYYQLDKVVSGMHEPTGYELPYSEQISRHVKVPSLVIGRFRTLEEADQVIRDKAADMVGMTRAHIADPEIVNKTTAGRAFEVRPCIGCNQGCIGQVMAGIPMGCAINPGVGFESSLGDHLATRAETQRSVIVIGGGPSGLEAARVAAQRGHKVKLFEARSVLGGSLRFASMAPTRQTMADVLTWLEQEIYRLGVEVNLNAYVDAEEIRRENADVVLVATGAVPRMDGIQSSNPADPIGSFDQPHIFSSVDIFENPQLSFGKNVVVIDDVGHYEAIAVAEHLLNKGSDVTFVTTQISFAPRSDPALMAVPALRRMTPKGLKVMVRTRAMEITKNSVITAPVYLDSHSNVREEIPADNVVFVSLNRCETSLAEALRESGTTVKIIGDALSPRFLPDAMRDGRIAGMAI